MHTLKRTLLIPWTHIQPQLAAQSFFHLACRYVVDTGLMKQRQFHARTGVDTLLITPISKAQVNSVSLFVLPSRHHLR